MRPTSLTIEGFGAFKSVTHIDFSDLDLVAFVGQTGAGKSTIIDAIGFALYGSVPRYDKVNVVSPVIHQLSNEAKVSLEFSLGNHIYRATRVVRRQNSKDPAKVRATTKEARLELVEPATSDTSEDEVTTKVLAGNVKELDAVVEELLGLSFAQFTKTIVLPQGAFAKFLTDEPASRQKLIRRLLDLEIYSQMGTRARERAKAADAQLEVLEAEKQRYQEGLAGVDVKSLARQLKALEKFGKEVSSRQIELEKIDSQITPLVESQNKISASIDKLANLNQHKDVSSLIAQLDVAPVEAALADAQATLEETTSLEAAAQKTVLSLEESEVLSEQIQLYNKIGELKDSQAELSESFNSLTAEIATKEKDAKKLEKAADNAKSKLEEAKVKDAAAGIRQHLHVGDACPVCENTVDDLTGGKSKINFAQLTQTQIETEQSYRQTSAELATMSGRAESAEQQLTELANSLKKLENETKKLEPIDVLEKRLQQNTEAQQELVGTKKALATAVKAHTLASAELEKVRQTERGLMSSFTKVRDTVAELSPPTVTDDGVLVNWKRLNEWAANETQTLESKLGEVTAEADQIKKQRNTISSELLTQANDLELNLAQVSDIAPALTQAQHEIETQTASANSVANEVERLKTEIETLTEKRTKDYSLSRHLNATGFEGWLLAEALGDICASATERLMELTGGQFSLQLVGRQFYVVDHNNASERRDVKTLSGGETFLASLALALGLADSIAELTTSNSVTLGSMFLDEGFGTLDTETLDVVASAIEELAATGRMIGVVTHVRELAERLPTRFEVTKGPASSWVEKVER